MGIISDVNFGNQQPQLLNDSVSTIDNLPPSILNLGPRTVNVTDTISIEMDASQIISRITQTYNEGIQRANEDIEKLKERLNSIQEQKNILLKTENNLQNQLRKRALEKIELTLALEALDSQSSKRTKTDATSNTPMIQANENESMAVDHPLAPQKKSNFEDLVNAALSEKESNSEMEVEETSNFNRKSKATERQNENSSKSANKPVAAKKSHSNFSSSENNNAISIASTSYSKPLKKFRLFDDFYDAELQASGGSIPAYYSRRIDIIECLITEIKAGGGGQYKIVFTKNTNGDEKKVSSQIWMDRRHLMPRLPESSNRPLYLLFLKQMNNCYSLYALTEIDEMRLEYPGIRIKGSYLKKGREKAEISTLIRSLNGCIPVRKNLVDRLKLNVDASGLQTLKVCRYYHHKNAL